MTPSSFSSIVIPPEWQVVLRRWFNFQRVLWALTLMCFLIAWNRGLALLYGLFSLLLALLMVSYLMPRRQLRHIQVVRQFAGTFTAGRPASITYHLKTHRTRNHVELIEAIEFAEKKNQHFFFEKISGQASCKLQFTCLRRGCFWLRDIQLTSAYPFGIVWFSKFIQTEPAEILVFPKVVEFSGVPMPLVADATAWGDVFIPQKGGRDEFSTVREYSHGDELNRIHWPVSARHQNLVVKAYEKTDRPSMLVVLDCRKKFNVGEANRSTFEFAVSIAASMIRSASRDGMQCFLVAQSDRWQELTVQAFSTDLYALYELLARLNGDSHHPYYPIVEQAHRRFPQANLVATFRLESDPTLPELSPQVTHIDLEMDEKSFRFPDQPGVHNHRHRQGNRLIYRVCADRKLENLFQ
jgi:uncharacterized protein (DUF58 family)